MRFSTSLFLDLNILYGFFMNRLNPYEQCFVLNFSLKVTLNFQMFKMLLLDMKTHPSALFQLIVH